MTAKQVAITPDENKEIWGWCGGNGDTFYYLTRDQAEKEALKFMSEFPEGQVFIFKMIATVENKPFIKELK